jgi:hypothetical protein
MAEGEGFEPPLPHNGKHDFESRAFVHSATPPHWEGVVVGILIRRQLEIISKANDSPIPGASWHPQALSATRGRE